MRKPATMKALEKLGRVRLSPNFFMRDMLYSEISNFHGIPNIPDNPELAIAAGTRLCEKLLEPLHASFGQVSIRSAFRSVAINDFGHERKNYNCGETTWNHSRHVWDRRDGEGYMGATACITIPWFLERHKQGTSWEALAWWIHDHLPYADMVFFSTMAFNLRWHQKRSERHEKPNGRIESHTTPKGCLTKPGMANHTGDHSEHYPDFPELRLG